MPGTHQHAAFARDDREGMPRHHEVRRLCVARHGGLHGTRSVLRRDSGRHTFGGLDRHRKRGPVRARVVVRHLRQTQLVRPRLGDRQANQAARVRDHEVDRFRRHVVGGEDDVALVFAVFVIDQHDHAPGADFLDDFLDRRNGGRFAL